MRRTIIQIVQLLAVLIVLLMVPLFIESQRLQNRQVKAEITSEAVSSEAQSFALSENQNTNHISQNTMKIGGYIVFGLFTISTITFIKYKISKVKHAKQ